MKRLILILPLLLLLLSACGLLDPESTEDPIPTDEYTPVSGWKWETGGNDPDEQGKTIVKTVLSYESEIPVSDPVRSCVCRLPMIDLSGAEAMACNQEIEDRFGVLIRQSRDAIEKWEEPVLERMDYSSFTRDDILTLRIVFLEYNGSEQEAWYTVDAVSGDAVSIDRLFAAAGMSGQPDQLVTEAVEARFRARFGTPKTPDAAWTTALNRSQSAIVPLTVNRMHLTEDGKLIVAVEIFAPDGGSSIETLILP